MPLVILHLRLSEPGPARLEPTSAAACAAHRAGTLPPRPRLPARLSPLCGALRGAAPRRSAPLSRRGTADKGGSVRTPEWWSALPPRRHCCGAITRLNARRATARRRCHAAMARAVAPVPPSNPVLMNLSVWYVNFMAAASADMRAVREGAGAAFGWRRGATTTVAAAEHVAEKAMTEVAVALGGPEGAQATGRASRAKPFRASAERPPATAAGPSARTQRGRRRAKEEPGLPTSPDLQAVIPISALLAQEARAPCSVGAAVNLGQQRPASRQRIPPPPGGCQEPAWQQERRRRRRWRRQRGPWRRRPNLPSTTATVSNQFGVGQPSPASPADAAALTPLPMLLPSPPPIHGRLWRKMTWRMWTRRMTTPTMPTKELTTRSMQERRTGTTNQRLQVEGRMRLNSRNYGLLIAPPAASLTKRRTASRPARSSAPRLTGMKRRGNESGQDTTSSSQEGAVGPNRASRCRGQGGRAPRGTRRSPTQHGAPHQGAARPPRRR